jgi:hypothetical protein
LASPRRRTNAILNLRPYAHLLSLWPAHCRPSAFLHHLRTQLQRKTLSKAPPEFQGRRGVLAVWLTRSEHTTGTTPALVCSTRVPGRHGPRCRLASDFCSLRRLLPRPSCSRSLSPARSHALGTSAWVRLASLDSCSVYFDPAASPKAAEKGEEIAGIRL